MIFTYARVVLRVLSRVLLSETTVATLYYFFLCVTRVINDDNDVDGRTLMLNNSKVVEITQQLLLLFALINFSCNLSVSH